MTKKRQSGQREKQRQKRDKKRKQKQQTRRTFRLPPHGADRLSAFAKLDAYIDDRWVEEEELAFEEFWGPFLDREDELPNEFRPISEDAELIWFAFDRGLDDGSRVVDHFLREVVLRPGERAFVEAMGRATMRLYEVVDLVPGSTITLRDRVEGTVITVNERSASRTLPRGECVAARVLARGESGGPEIERGLLHVPEMLVYGVQRALEEERAEFVAHRPGTSIDLFYRGMPPLFHEAWLTGFLDPPVPRLQNTDGDDMVTTCVRYQVDDEPALRQALDRAEDTGVARVDDTSWSWSGPGATQPLVLLASFELRGGELAVEANSVERGRRARELVERLAGTIVRHRATTHEDMQRKVKEAVSGAVGGRGGPAPEALPPEIAEALILDHYAVHYRRWVDEPVPALDGLSPRAAAARPEMRARAEELVRGLEHHYERALKDGTPAYDPSWMWTELGLAASLEPAHPPPLAHERVAARVPGSEAACRGAAARARALPSFDDAVTTLSVEDLRMDLELQRLVRRERPAANDTDGEGELAAPYVPLMVNLELHRRKVFWVDSALSCMLERTDIDLPAEELRVPFPSFAVVFTDRYALSRAERLLARRPADPLRGQILRVMTVYVTERRGDDGRALDVDFALDALGADLPSLVHFDVPADGDASVAAFLEQVAPRGALVDGQVLDASPERALLRLLINAILYATSAGVTPDERPATVRPAGALAALASGPHGQSSDAVFFLPGNIDIRRLQQLAELDRAPGGRAALARFMVRGHWRRADRRYKDQALRWIKPYWKGPDMAAVIEKAYRLRP